MDQTIGRMLIILGLIFVVIGAAFFFSDRIPLIGKLPGDIRIERESFRFYFPLGTSILLSILLTAVLWVISMIGRK